MSCVFVYGYTSMHPLCPSYNLPIICPPVNNHSSSEEIFLHILNMYMHGQNTSMHPPESFLQFDLNLSSKQSFYIRRDMFAYPKLVDCPTQLTLIFILWYLYLSVE